MTSLQSQYMLCPPLACNTARTHQQPKIGTSGYFTWETGPWHQISQVSNEYRRRQSETVSVKTAYAPTRRPYFGAELRRRHRLARVRCCNRVRVGKPAKLEERLVQRWIKIHVEDKRWLYTCLQTPECEVRKELRPWGRQSRRRKCDDVGSHILRLKNSTGAHPWQP